MQIFMINPRQIRQNKYFGRCFELFVFVENSKTILNQILYQIIHIYLRILEFNIYHFENITNILQSKHSLQSNIYK